MKTLSALILLVLICFHSVQGQLPDNMSFEQNRAGAPLPFPWFKWGNDEYRLIQDSTTASHGKYSLRIERTSGTSPDKAFGCVTQALLTGYKGKTITLKAWMKYENIDDGLVRLLLQVADPQDKRTVDDMEKLNLHGTSGWKEYSVTIPYPENAKTIYFGALNSGKGKLWVDDFQLFIDGKPLSELETQRLATPPPVTGTEKEAIHRISASLPLPPGNTQARDYAYWECEHLNHLPPGQVTAHPAAAVFPGKVSPTAPRISRKIMIRHHPVPARMRPVTDNLLYSGKDNETMYSTGLYAAPGEIVTVDIPESLVGKLSIRIGCHTDDLQTGWSAGEAWRRMPQIVRQEPLRTTRTQVASAFGGLVYLTCSPYDAAFEGIVTVSNAVAAPRFILGKTTQQEWEKMIAAAGAPWGEIEGHDIILTCSVEALEKMTKPAEQAEMWDKVVNACYDLAQIPTPFFRKQRIVTDVHIMAGYMHSGYPIMATHCPSLNMNSEEVIVQYEKLLRPSSEYSGWGFFHEIGHNMQNVKDWVFNGSTEVSVNFFSLYIFDHVMGARDHAHPKISSAQTQEMMRRYFANGAKFSDWRADPFLGLIMFRQIQNDFGWETFKKVFRRFHEENARNGNPPYSDQEKIDHFVLYLSQATQRNLMPFFCIWGIPVSGKIAGQVNGFKEWMPYRFPPVP